MSSSSQRSSPPSSSWEQPCSTCRHLRGTEGVPADIAALTATRSSSRSARYSSVPARRTIQLLTGYFTKPTAQTGSPAADRRPWSSPACPWTGVCRLFGAAHAGAVYGVPPGGQHHRQPVRCGPRRFDLLTTVRSSWPWTRSARSPDNAQGIAEMSGTWEAPGLVLNSLDAVTPPRRSPRALRSPPRYSRPRWRLPPAVEAELGPSSAFRDQPDVLVGVIIQRPLCSPGWPLWRWAVLQAASSTKSANSSDPAGDHGRHGEANTAESSTSARATATGAHHPGLLAVLTPSRSASPSAARSARSSAGTRRAPSCFFLANPAVPGQREETRRRRARGKGLKRTSHRHQRHHRRPLQDTAGPAINPLLKVMNLVALLIAPSVVIYANNPPCGSASPWPPWRRRHRVGKRRSTDGNLPLRPQDEPEAGSRPGRRQGAGHGRRRIPQSDRRLSARRKPVAPGSTRLPFPARRPWNPATFRVVWAPYSTHGRLTA